MNSEEESIIAKQRMPDSEGPQTEFGGRMPDNFDSEDEVYDNREKFGIEYSLIRMNLEYLMEKLQRVEEALNISPLKQDIRSHVSKTDFYKPDSEMEPPRKRSKTDK